MNIMVPLTTNSIDIIVGVCGGEYQNMLSRVDNVL